MARQRRRWRYEIENNVLELDTANALVNAVLDEGPHPEYHNRKLEELRVEWPMLYDALMDTIKELVQ